MTIDSTDYRCDYEPAGGTSVNLGRSTNTNSGGSEIGLVSSYAEMHFRYLYAISLQD